MTISLTVMPGLFRHLPVGERDDPTFIAARAARWTPEQVRGDEEEGDGDRGFAPC